MNSTIIVTGGDEGFAPMLRECAASLASSGVLDTTPLGILDQGLSAETVHELESLYGCKVVRAEWPDFVPTELRDPVRLGLVSRPLLRELFPGHDLYLWFDADAWVQRPDFLDVYVQGARATGAAVAKELGPGYGKRLITRRWWVGNMLAAFGPYRGGRLSAIPSVNIGLLALTDTAEHWARWMSAYEQTVLRTGKLNLDQHAFHAAANESGVTTTYVDSIHNWLPILSVPQWNAEARLLCEPGGRRRPLNVIHLAGPDKGRTYTLNDGAVSTPLTHTAIGDLRSASSI